ncbi:GMC family oxidoreductase [Methylomarinum vadi]|uniref:GMC family oxidoreductase n=1 Tax=Methylomarinum vadi TaxID=438855 RepID=UPI0004DF0803|nr:GMC family oxidoreductase [Methylomarinum vadi]
MKDQVYDVVIIGAGAGGGACAWALTRSGINVLLLEAGPEYDPLKDYRLDQWRWERDLFPDKQENHTFYDFAPLQALNPQLNHLRSWNHITGYHNKSAVRQAFRYHHIRGVGGSTLHFTGEAHRMNPTSMQMETLFQTGADWPLSYRDIEPYYLQAEQVIGVAGPENDLRAPRSSPYPLPAHPLSFASRKLAEGMQKIGLTPAVNSRAALSRPYDGRPACNYCANCNRGCPRTDKGSVDITFIRKARKTGRLSLLTETTALHIDAGRDDRIRSVTVDNRSGIQKLYCRTVVLAAGAIQTPRLLLLSTNPNAAEGLANESGLVGRHFMETLHWSASGLYPKHIGSQRGLPADLICWDYNEPNAIPGVIGGCRFGSSVSEADLLGPINYATRVVSGWGSAHKQQMLKNYGNVISVSAIGEHLSNPHSFIELHPNQIDQNGQPKALIHSHLADSDIKRLEFMALKCREILNACGIEAIFEQYGSYDFFNSTHVFGTCRMGKKPDTSVVDPYGQSHRWKNLFIADASVFPTTGGGEGPSLTIEALAIRTAEKIRQLMSDKAL